MRICGDVKLTVSQATKVDKYPVPKIQELCAKVGGGKKFTELDLSQAYQQVKLDEASKASNWSTPWPFSLQPASIWGGISPE